MLKTHFAAGTAALIALCLSGAPSMQEEGVPQTPLASPRVIKNMEHASAAWGMKAPDERQTVPRKG